MPRLKRGTPPPRGGGSWLDVFPFEKLAPGESQYLTVPLHDGHSAEYIQRYVLHYLRRFRAMRFTTRQASDGVRVWRIR
jgi:hypothetical protein